MCVCVCVCAQKEVKGQSDFNRRSAGFRMRSKANVIYLFMIYLVTDINPLNTKRRPLYLKTQSVPRCKHFSSRL